jgi:predicted MFS family arabinose efflux permease
VIALLRHPGVATLLAVNVLARIPTAGASVLLVVHVHALTGSYAAAGAVSAACALSLALAAPLLGGLVDRRGQTGVLVAAGLVSGAAYVTLGLLPHSAPTVALALVAALAGAAQPPAGACLRTLWPDLLAGDEAAIGAAFSLEAAVLELTYIAGPLGLLTLAAVTTSSLAVVVTGVTMTAGTLAFAARPESRAWRPHDAGGAPRERSALSEPGVRTIVAIMAVVGALVAGVEVAVAAATHDAGVPGANGPLLAVWGLGSLLGGVLAARAGGARDLTLLLVGLAATHALLAAGAGTMLVLAGLLLVAGAFVAPVFGTTAELTGALAPPGTATEAFAWTSTALGAGVAVGAAAAGVIVDAAGPAPAFFASGAVGLLAAVVAISAPARRVAEVP